APYPGLAEETINLDISLRLRAMLEAAGARVVMVRSTDAEVNDPPSDVTGNGTIDQWDELAARVDIGNLARADVHVNPHNNASDCHCASGTGMYTWFGRTWSPEGIALAQQILDAHMRELAPFATANWQPRSRGVIERKFAAVRPYSASNWPRPSLQPTMLGESLFGDSVPEGRFLQTAAVRQAIAVAYYDGLARWFASRTYGVRYEMLEAPSAAAAGSAVDYRVRLTNNGNSVSDGWTLEARSVPAVPLYDGSGLAGDLRGSVAVPDGLAPGESVDLVIPSTAPPDAGDWLMKLDITLLGTDTMAFHGVVSPQLPLVTSLPQP
ncbi:MAG: N-acetylmuramoyl-L-alanine amidase, partial [Candidatus Limnocylindrales bacterium]